MSAADDYPARRDGTTWTVDQWPEMCAEIDELRDANDRLRHANIRLDMLLQGSGR